MLCLVAYAVYLYNKPHTTVDAVTPAVIIKANNLYAAFEHDEAIANKQFVDKVILVKGTVNEITHTGSTLTVLLESNNITGGISCNLPVTKSLDNKMKRGMPVSIKGRCTGFLNDVILADCVIEK